MIRNEIREDDFRSGPVLFFFRAVVPVAVKGVGSLDRYLLDCRLRSAGDRVRAFLLCHVRRHKGEYPAVKEVSAVQRHEVASEDFKRILLLVQRNLDEDSKLPAAIVVEIVREKTGLGLREACEFAADNWSVIASKSGLLTKLPQFLERHQQKPETE